MKNKKECRHPVSKRIHNFDGHGHEACKCGAIHGWYNQNGNAMTDQIWYYPKNQDEKEVMNPKIPKEDQVTDLFMKEWHDSIYQKIEGELYDVTDNMMDWIEQLLSEKDKEVVEDLISITNEMGTKEQKKSYLHCLLDVEFRIIELKKKYYEQIKSKYKHEK